MRGSRPDHREPSRPGSRPRQRAISSRIGISRAQAFHDPVRRRRVGHATNGIHHVMMREVDDGEDHHCAPGQHQPRGTPPGEPKEQEREHGVRGVQRWEGGDRVAVEVLVGPAQRAQVQVLRDHQRDIGHRQGLAIQPGKARRGHRQHHGGGELGDREQHERDHVRVVQVPPRDPQHECGDQRQQEVEQVDDRHHHVEDGDVAGHVEQPLQLHGGNRPERDRPLNGDDRVRLHA